VLIIIHLKINDNFNVGEFIVKTWGLWGIFKKLKCNANLEIKKYITIDLINKLRI